MCFQLGAFPRQQLSLKGLERCVHGGRVYTRVAVSLRWCPSSASRVPHQERGAWCESSEHTVRGLPLGPKCGGGAAGGAPRREPPASQALLPPARCGDTPLLSCIRSGFTGGHLHKASYLGSLSQVRRGKDSLPRPGPPLLSSLATDASSSPPLSPPTWLPPPAPPPKPPVALKRVCPGHPGSRSARPGPSSALPPLGCVIPPAPRTPLRCFPEPPLPSRPPQDTLPTGSGCSVHLKPVL